MAEERETIITNGRGGGGGGAAIAIVALLAVIVVLFLLFGRGMLNGGGTHKVDADVKIDTPKS